MREESFLLVVYNQIFTCFLIFTMNTDEFLECLFIVIMSFLPRLSTPAFTELLCVPVGLQWTSCGCGAAGPLFCSQSYLSADQHDVQHNVGPLPCEQGTSVNRRENRECLGDGGAFNWDLMVCRDS